MSIVLDLAMWKIDQKQEGPCGVLERQKRDKTYARSDAV